MQDHDVVGIGNAIVDIIAHCDDAFLTRHDQRKGSMQLVDDATVARLYESMGPAVEGTLAERLLLDLGALAKS
jgi:sugar/nucleoside kinase (ribokinase family)